jgi:hypothetical protein
MTAMGKAGGISQEEREEAERRRLGEALRANLNRRKAQSRNRRTPPQSGDAAPASSRREDEDRT